MSIKSFLLFIIECNLVNHLYTQTSKGAVTHRFHSATNTNFGRGYFWVGTLILMMIFALFSACGKEVSLEDKRLEEVSRSWELRDGDLFWELSQEDPLYQCTIYGGIEISSDKSASGHLPVFNLLLLQNRTFSLDYSIALQPDLQFCNGMEYELETPDRIEKLEGNLQGIFEITVAPVTSILTGGNLSYITLQADFTGKYYGGSVSFFSCSKYAQENGECLLSVEFSNLFEPDIIARLRLKSHQ